jgi:hypothetical protein
MTEEFARGAGGHTDDIWDDTLRATGSHLARRAPNPMCAAVPSARQNERYLFGDMIYAWPGCAPDRCRVS